jgi:hypothetical protein
LELLTQRAAFFAMQESTQNNITRRDPFDRFPSVFKKIQNTMLGSGGVYFDAKTADAAAALSLKTQLKNLGYVPRLSSYE